VKYFNTINRYIFKELLNPFLISLFLLTFIFLIARIPKLTNMAINYDADIPSVALMVLYMMPRFLEFSIPLSIAISILLTCMRMAGDNEVIALNGVGVSLYQMLPPVMIFCMLGVLLTSLTTIFAVSWGKFSLKMMCIELTESKLELVLQERQFHSEFENMTMYVSHVDIKTKRLKDIFIEDRRNADMLNIFIAPSGEVIQHKENSLIYTIKLYDGIINQEDLNRGSINRTKFQSAQINIDLNNLSIETLTPEKTLDERSFLELIGLIRSGIVEKWYLSSALTELHEKFAIPIACLSLGFLSFPLGIQSRSLNRFSGLSLGGLFFLFQYILFAAGWSAGKTGKFPPMFGMWIPNIVIGGIGIFFLIRNARQQPVKLPGFIKKAVFYLTRRV